MPYSVQFVGLVCFYRERGGRLALLPDGSDPGPDIDPHYGSIVLASDAIEETSGWPDAPADGPGRTFELPPCEVVIAGADDTGVLDVEAHDGKLPQLSQIDSNFEIDPDRARTVARIHIRQGKLTAYRIPGGDAAISQLDVTYDGKVTITVKPDDGSPHRTIVARPGTEVAIANMRRGGYDQRSTKTGSHFRIYEKLSVRPVTLHEPDVRSVAHLAQSTSKHVLFSRKGPIGLYVDCTNTGCC